MPGCVPKTVSLNFDPAELTPSLDQVDRYFGGSGYKSKGSARRLAEDCVQWALQLISPVAAFSCHPVTMKGDGAGLCLPGGVFLQLPDSGVDPRATALAAVIGSLGSGLEECCRSLASDGRVYQSTLLDAVGTAMLDLLDMRLRCTLEDYTGECGLFVGGRFSPGLAEYPLEQQKLLFELVGEGTAGVKLNEASIMKPVKSISFFRLLSPVKSENDSSNKCRDCQMGKCRFRVPG